MKHLIHDPCPDFIAPALMPGGELRTDFRLSDHFAGRYGILFFFPLDFNFVSARELLAIQERLNEFSDHDTAIVAISCDSYLAHRVWQTMPQEADGLGALGFPVVADMTRNVARLFDVLVSEAMPEAATLIVNPENEVIFQVRFDTAIGRNIDRFLHVVQQAQDPAKEPTSPVEQILLLEKSAPELQRLGFKIVAQSVDTDLDHPQWKMIPRDANGKPKLSFPFLADKSEWPKHSGMTLAAREGLDSHSTALLMPDGQLVFEHHSDRYVPRDFAEILRTADAFMHHFKTGEVIPWGA